MPHGVPDAELPPNFAFVFSNLEQLLGFDDRTFDYIHIRNIDGYLTKVALHQLYAKVIRMLRPGGWFEHSEVNVTMDTPAWEYFQTLRCATGRHTQFGADLVEYFGDAGFCDVENTEFLLAGDEIEGNIFGPAVSTYAQLGLQSNTWATYMLSLCYAMQYDCMQDLKVECGRR